MRTTSKRTGGVAILQFCGLVYCALHATSSAAVPIQLSINQVAEADGSFVFSMRVSGWPFVDLIAPDGTMMPTHGFFGDLSHQELSDRFFGEWTIEDSSPAAPYHFSLSPPPLHPVATVVSPLDGTTVGTTFEAAWEFPAGFSPSGPAMAFWHLPQDVVITSDLSQANLTSGTVHVDLGSNAMTQIQVRGGGVESLFDFLSPVSPPAIPPHSVSGTYASFSPPVSVTVVPEPCGLALASLGVAVWIAGSFARRRRAIAQG